MLTKKSRLLVALLCSFTTSAWALSDPTTSPKDGADRTVAYDPHNRVPLVIQQGGLAVITFDPMESIEQVVKVDSAPFGYSCDNAGSDQKQQCEASYSNNLPLVGKTTGSGDLVVLTRGAPPSNDKERAYLFAVRVVAGDDPQITKHLTFSYPAQYQTPVPADNKPRVLSWKERKAQHDAEIIRARLRGDVTFGPQNTRYLAQGTAHSLAPVAAFDNGMLTAFRYPGNMSQPAVFKVIDNHESTPEVCVPGGHATKDELEAPEQAVNSRVVDDLLTVDETAPHWRLRSGGAVLDVWNCAYDPVGHNPETGTESPDVIRRIIQP
jgi:type IV secretion system protein VirB9